VYSADFTNSFEAYSAQELKKLGNYAPIEDLLSELPERIETRRGELTETQPAKTQVSCSS